MFFKKMGLGLLVFTMMASCQSQKQEAQTKPLAQQKSSQKQAELDLRNRVEKLVLDNGMTFLFMNRGNAPVFSAQMKVKVGNIEEEPGQSGLAHFFEHMAFKGTKTIGSKDFEKENEILQKIFETGQKIVEAKKVGQKPEDYKTLSDELKKLQDEQDQWIVKNEFVRVYQRNGGTGLNATTSNDFTTYYISLPTSKLELWAYMESERFLNGVMREFFNEVGVVAEERRMRIDNTPQGKLYEALMKAAFQKSPYRILAVGTAEDIQLYNPKDAAAFFDRYYIPSRMVVSVVGNFDVAEAKSVVKKYFSRLPAKKDQEKTFAKEDLGQGYPKEVTVYDDAQPRFYLTYHRPAHPHKDDVVLDVVQSLLCDGKTSRLYKRLVLKEKKVSGGVGCGSGLPGNRLDSVFTFYAVPLESSSNKEVKAILIEELNKMAKEGPTPIELQIVKNNMEASFIYSLQSNMGLASALARYESLTGDWKYVYDFQDRVRKITAAEVMEVAKKYFVPERQTTAYLEKEKKKEGQDG